jgi:hypothetical protein
MVTRAMMRKITIDTARVFKLIRVFHFLRGFNPT